MRARERAENITLKIDPKIETCKKYKYLGTELVSEDAKKRSKIE